MMLDVVKLMAFEVGAEVRRKLSASQHESGM
jgi:hypothetical protein